MTGSRLRPFGTTIFSEMTRLANEHGAVNLAQGFPDFEGPAEIVDAAVEALRTGQNQYARSAGHPLLVKAIAEKQRRDYGLEWDPESEVIVFSGATEGIAAALLGLLEPGDEVIAFEPYFDSYPVICALAGATLRTVTLRFPSFAVDLDALKAAITPRTRVLLLNTPHNPTGKVFTRAELEAISEFCLEHGLVVITDEVYEHLVWGESVHVPMASLPGMKERTLSLSSAGKTFSFTGWKVGWGTGPRPLVAAAQAAHQYLVFATATPLQIAVATALVSHGPAWLARMNAEYAGRRAFLLAALERAGFRVAPPEGTYFVLADFSALSDLDDRAFARELVTRYGVAAIPPSAFYGSHPEQARSLLRFAFCKKLETLEEAARRLETLAAR